MNRLTANEIHEIRQTLGWSAREMGEFFDRTGVTIYHWESGKTTPGNNVMVLFKALKQELLQRQEKYSEDELQAWTDRLLDQGIETLLDTPSERVSVSDEGISCQRLIQLANEQGGTSIRSESGETLAYVVPNTTSGLLRWARKLLERTAGTSRAVQLQSDLSPHASGGDISIPVS